MGPSIRPARPADRAAIAAFTADTFEWGDYVSEVLLDWLDEPAGHVLVATDEEDRPVALGRGLLLSRHEVWLQGMRVREEWRRRRLGSAISEGLIAWAQERGARVARLGVEHWNEAAQRQVESIGFRCVGRWVVARQAIQPEPSPETPSNGGKRAKARRRLEQAPSSEAEPAWVSWRSGPLVAPARGMYVSHWKWATLDFQELRDAGRSGNLWSSQAGWALVGLEEDQLTVGWLECGPDDATDMIRSLLDLAVAAEADRLQITVPAITWIEQALAGTGFELMTMLIYERPL
jgi:GNAT superfamily N-acetyltransferase